MSRMVKVTCSLCDEFWYQGWSPLVDPVQDLSGHWYCTPECRDCAWETSQGMIPIPAQPILAPIPINPSPPGPQGLKAPSWAIPDARNWQNMDHMPLHPNSDIHKKALNGQTHGACRGGRSTSAYQRWGSMKSRCLNPRHCNYSRYGARGITVCARWLNSFEAFIQDMGEPLPGQSIDRIDNNGNYDPSNCRWATIKEQGRNKRNNFLIEAFGEIKAAPAWVDDPRCHVMFSTLKWRVRHGWPAELAMTATPRIFSPANKRPVRIMEMVS